MIGLRFAHPWLLLFLGGLVPIYFIFGVFAEKTSRRLDGLRLASRIGVYVILVLAISTPQVSKSIDKVNLIFLADLSDSMGAQAEQKTIDYINLTTRSMDGLSKRGWSRRSSSAFKRGPPDRSYGTTGRTAGPRSICCLSGAVGCSRWRSRRSRTQRAPMPAGSPLFARRILGSTSRRD